MSPPIDRKTDQLRVLSGVPALVVRALLDEESEADPFADALRRYREEGPPQVATWRAPQPRTSSRATDVLRRLARDLLSRVTADEDAVGTDAVEAPPANVHAIAEARETPALEQASDGTWRPSAAIAAVDEVDATARRRVVPQLRSRYPDLSAAAEPEGMSGGVRFRQITVPASVETVAPAAPIASVPAGEGDRAPTTRNHR